MTISSRIGMGLLLILFFLSNGVNAQSDQYEKQQTIMVSVVRPMIGELEAGFLFDADELTSVLIYGRYNFNRIAEYQWMNDFDYPYYAYGDHEVEAYTIGAQARFLLNKGMRDKVDYRRYLEKQPIPINLYTGIWLDHTDGIIHVPFPYGYYNEWHGSYEITSNIPRAEKKFNTTTVGVLFGMNHTFNDRIVLDIFGGIGVRYMESTLKEPLIEFNYDDHRIDYINELSNSFETRTFITGQFGLQVGYQLK